MKKIYTIILIFCGLFAAKAQTDAISYQAVILNPVDQEIPGVDAAGNVLSNTGVSLRFTIYDANGVIEYQERQNTTTDDFGLVNVFIGEGIARIGRYDQISWDGTGKDLEVEVDFNRGSEFVFMSRQKLTFTPFAFHRNITASGSLTVDGLSQLKDDLIVDGQTALNGSLNVVGLSSFLDDVSIEGNAAIEQDIFVNGVSQLNNDLFVNNGSTTNLSGDLLVAGETILEGDFQINGISVMNNGLTVNGNTELNGTLGVMEDANFDQNLAVSGDMEVTGSANFGSEVAVLGTLGVTDMANFEADVSVAGTFGVTQETTLDNDLTVNGLTILNDDTEIDGNLIVSQEFEVANLNVSSDGGLLGEHVAIFENTSGSQDADGIAIKIDTDVLSIDNHFVSFYGADDYLAGRIESYDLVGGDLFESFPVPNFETLLNVFDFSGVINWTPPSLDFDDGSLPSIDFEEFDFDPGDLPDADLNPGSLSFNFDGVFDATAGSEAASQIGEMIGWGMRNGYPGYLPTSKWKIILTPLFLAAKQVARNQGIVYGSKGADYAEWLEKENAEDSFVFGEVVGVKGGKISRNTTDADQVLSISYNPIVLGNMPEHGEENAYEKVGFMGQVPVLVAGKVAIGDFVVASGNNDGYAVAVSADDIQIKDLKNIIRRAWSESEPSGLSMINVSVGLKTNEWIVIFEQHEDKIRALENQLLQMEQFEKKLDKLEAKLEQLGME